MAHRPGDPIVNKTHAHKHAPRRHGNLPPTAAAVRRAQDVAVLADSKGTFAPPVDIEQQGVFGQARNDGIPVNRLRHRLGQAGTKEQQDDAAALPSRDDAIAMLKRRTGRGEPRPVFGLVGLVGE